MFIFLFLLFMVLGYFILKASFPDMHLPRIGVLDYIMGAAWGILIAIIVISLIINAFGVMTREQWQNPVKWTQAITTYRTSIYRPLSRQVLGIYQWSFRIFYRDLPPALTPQ